MGQHFERLGGLKERQVYRAEAELFISPGTDQARVHRRTTWFDRHGLVVNQEDAEWVGPVMALFDGESGGQVGRAAGRIESRGAAATPEPDTAVARSGSSNRLADFALLVAFLLALVAISRFVVPW